jgi:hypothetical protein
MPCSLDSCSWNAPCNSRRTSRYDCQMRASRLVSHPDLLTTSTKLAGCSPHECRQKGRQQVTNSEIEALKAVVRRNTEQVQGQGDFALFDDLFADDFVDHTPQPTVTSSPHARSTTVLISATFSASPPPARPSTSKPSTRCGSATGRSPTTGDWLTSTPYCNGSGSYRPDCVDGSVRLSPSCQLASSRRAVSWADPGSVV